MAKDRSLACCIRPQESYVLRTAVFMPVKNWSLMGYGLESNMWQEYYTCYVTGQLAERQVAEFMFFFFWL